MFIQHIHAAPNAGNPKKIMMEIHLTSAHVNKKSTMPEMPQNNYWQRHQHRSLLQLHSSKSRHVKGSPRRFVVYYMHVSFAAFRLDNAFATLFLQFFFYHLPLLANPFARRGSNLSLPPPEEFISNELVSLLAITFSLVLLFYPLYLYFLRRLLFSCVPFDHCSCVQLCICAVIVFVLEFTSG